MSEHGTAGGRFGQLASASSSCWEVEGQNVPGRGAQNRFNSLTRAYLQKCNERIDVALEGGHTDGSRLEAKVVDYGR